MNLMQSERRSFLSAFRFFGIFRFSIPNPPLLADKQYNGIALKALWKKRLKKWPSAYPQI
jgi:hypothetical protein